MRRELVRFTLVYVTDLRPYYIRAQDMAAEFPHCDITSIDIAPIASHTPRANITFEIYDLYAGVAEPDESFDYVSCRHTQLHASHVIQTKYYLI